MRKASKKDKLRPRLTIIDSHQGYQGLLSSKSSSEAETGCKRTDDLAISMDIPNREDLHDVFASAFAAGAGKDPMRKTIEDLSLILRLSGYRDEDYEDFISLFAEGQDQLISKEHFVKIMYDSVEGHLEQDEKIRPQESHVFSRMATNILNGAVSNVQRLQKNIIEKADGISFEYFQEELENIGVSGSEDRMQELFRIIQKQPISFETLAKFFILFKLDREEDTRAKQQGFIKKGAASMMKTLKSEQEPPLERLSISLMKRILDKSKTPHQPNKFKKRQTEKVINKAPLVSRVQTQRLVYKDRVRIRKWETLAMGISVLAACISAVFSGIIETWLQKAFGTDGTTDQLTESAGTDQSSHTTRQIQFWSYLVGSTLIISIIEVFIIYYWQIRCTASVSQIIGVDYNRHLSEDRDYMVASLARTALELKHSTKEEYGVNPEEELFKGGLLVFGFIYKAKTGVSTFLAKILVRRGLSRAAVKSFLPFVAVPVQMFWNWYETRKVVLRARVIATGPLQACQALPRLVALQTRLYETASGNGSKSRFPDYLREVVLRCIACVIVKRKEMHPNLHYLLSLCDRMWGVSPAAYERCGKSSALFRQLKQLNEQEQHWALQMLAFSIAMQGREINAETRLMFRRAGNNCGLVTNGSAYRHLTNLLLKHSLEPKHVSKLQFRKKRNGEKVDPKLEEAELEDSISTST